MGIAHQLIEPGALFSEWVAIEAGCVSQQTNRLCAMAATLEVSYDMLMAWFCSVRKPGSSNPGAPRLALRTHNQIDSLRKEDEVRSSRSCALKALRNSTGTLRSFS